MNIMSEISLSKVLNADPEVSVIIPTYNRQQFIKEAVESVLKQTYGGYEIIVVDDGSTDGTRDILSLYRDKIKYLFQLNKGPAAARNLGVQNSRGRFIAFLDSDDIWLPHKLEKQLEILLTNPAAAFVCSEAYVIDEEYCLRNHWKKNKDNIESFDGLRQDNFVCTQTVLLRRECFNEVGGFDTQLSNAQDYDLWLRLSMKYPFLYINEPFCLIRMHASNNTKNTDGRVNSYRKILRKKELWRTMPFLKRRQRIAGIYNDFAKCYARAKRYSKASFYNLKAIMQYPLFGVKNYYLTVSYFLKSMKNEKIGSDTK